MTCGSAAMLLAGHTWKVTMRQCCTMPCHAAMSPALPCPATPACSPYLSTPCPARFALGASERAVDVCYHNESKDVWAPRLIKKKHGSAVMVRCHVFAGCLALGQERMGRNASTAS